MKVRNVKWYGWRPSLPDHRDLRFLPRLAFSDLPASADLRGPFMPPVYDQKNLGSCTGNGVGACWQYALSKEGLAAPMPSRLLIYYFERYLEGTIKQDAGAEIRDGLKVLNKYGCCDEKLWPYVIRKFATKPSVAAINAAAAHKSTKYMAVNQSEHDIKSCLAQGYPVVFGFTVYDGFESAAVARSGVLNMPKKSESSLGGHCVTIVGYSDASRRYVVRNSWGSDWGQKGYFTMPYDYVHSAQLASDFWTVRIVA